jgi:hypothetical protein
MFTSTRTSLPILFFLATSACLFAQAKPEPDVLIFTNGEKLIGHLKSATGAKVVFKSDMAGEVTVEWSKIKELHSASKFAAIPKDVTLKNKADASAKAVRGSVTMADQKLEVTNPPSAPQTLPVANVSNVIDEPSFDQALKGQSFFQGWKGASTLGVAITSSTQDVQTLNSGINLVRSDPAESWLQVRTKTTVDFTASYSKITQPGTPSIKNALYHADAEEDFYASPRLFLLGGAVFDHSYSQGLDLQQTYDGGLGVVAHKAAHSEWDIRGDLGFTDQQFATSSLNKKLVGSRFGQTYNVTFAHGITFTEDAGARLAWNYEKAFSANMNTSLSMPVFKNLGVNINSFDSFVNNPPPGFKRNTFQIAFGIRYAIK